MICKVDKKTLFIENAEQTCYERYPLPHDLSQYICQGWHEKFIFTGIARWAAIKKLLLAQNVWQRLTQKDSFYLMSHAQPYEKMFGGSNTKNMFLLKMLGRSIRKKFILFIILGVASTRGLFPLKMLVRAGVKNLF